MREYRLMLNGNGFHSFKTLYEACYELAERLDAINCLNLLTEGKIETTYFLNKPYNKRYVIEIFVPPTKLELIKISKGDWNVHNLKEMLYYVQKMYNERI